MSEIASQFPSNIGARGYELIERLYPICRSITGNGVRETLSILGEYIPLEVHEVPTGTQVFDWKIPQEWNIRDAYVKDSSGQRIIDFQKNNLHVVSYSLPISQSLSLEELKPHLHSLPDHPDWIPYRTAYYSPTWGFCLSHRELEAMQAGQYEVVIDSTLQDGLLTYAESFVGGAGGDEFLVFAHICHPSLCNDNLSGVAVATLLAEHLSGLELRYSYRFVFAPATIGSIAWLAQNEHKLDRIGHGLVVSVLGDSGQLHYKKSRHGDAEIDRAVCRVLQQSGKPFRILEFTPYGYDERQFCSPGINLPVGRLTRTPNGEYDEYHTSADDLTIVTPEALADSLDTLVEVVALIEKNVWYENASPKCEPQLGRRGLYRTMGGFQDVGDAQYAMLWVLNLSDGANSLLDIAERSTLPFRLLASVAEELESAGLLRRVLSRSETDEPST